MRTGSHRKQVLMRCGGEDISLYSETFDSDAVPYTKDLLSSFYMKHWKLFPSGSPVSEMSF